MNYRDIDSLYNDDTYTTSTQGGNWTWTTTVKPPTTSTVTTTVTPSTAGQVYWGSSGSVGMGTVTPTVTLSDTKWTSGVIDAADVKIQGLGSVKELLQNLTFLTPPPGLDTDNPTVLDALKVWYQAVQELRQRHEQLQMLIKLTDETR